MSRQRVVVQLRPLLDAGELRREGLARAVKYLPGRPAETNAALPDEAAFWSALSREVAGFRYVRADVGQGRCTQPSAARHLAATFEDARFVVLDFAGVADAGERWLGALVGSPRSLDQHLVPINLTPRLRTKLERALRHLARKEELRFDWC